MLRNLSAAFQHTLGRFPAVFKDRPVLQCYGHPLLILPWQFGLGLGLALGLRRMPISLARVFGMGMPKTQGCPYHCDRGTHFGSSSLIVSKMTSGSEI